MDQPVSTKSIHISEGFVAHFTMVIYRTSKYIAVQYINLEIKSGPLSNRWLKLVHGAQHVSGVAEEAMDGLGSSYGEG